MSRRENHEITCLGVDGLCRMRWLAVILIVVIAAPVFAAEADFSTSTVSYDPPQAVAGDVLHFVVTVANTGDGDSSAEIKSTLPDGYFIRADGDCAATTLDRDYRSLVWHAGMFPAGSVRQCRIDLLTRRRAAGTMAPLVTEIHRYPSGYHRVEATPELATPSYPALFRLGPFGIRWAEIVTIGFFGFSAAGAAIVVRAARRRNKKKALGAWISIAIGIGFLLIFLDVAREEVRSYRDYREASCLVFGSNIRAVENVGGSSRSNTYDTEFAVRYVALGTDIYSSAYPPPSSVSLGGIGYSLRTLERFSEGSVHPCWFDPKDARIVLLERGPGAAYFFALLPLMMLAAGVWMLITEVRPDHRRRKASADPPIA